MRIDIPTPTFQRAPGEATGSFALESALDELAYALNMDPVELRVTNHAVRDEQEDKPFSSKSILECYRQAAQRFGWAKRNAKVGAMRDGDHLIGWGMASATYCSKMSPASAIARMKADGILHVQAGTQDIGTGTYTIMTQIAADAMGVPVEQVRFELGDSVFPETRVSGGSQTAASTGSAVEAAVTQLKGKLSELRKTADEPCGQVVARSGQLEITAEHKPEKRAEAHAFHSHGAAFAEVRVDPQLGEIRLARFVGA